MDASIPLIELPDDDNVSSQKEITSDDDIEVYKVPIVTLEDSYEIPVIILDTDETPTTPVVVIDDTGNNEVVSSLVPEESNSITDCTTISSDDSDVEIADDSALNYGEKCPRSLKNKVVSKRHHVGAVNHVQNISVSCDDNNESSMQNSSISFPKGNRSSPLKKKECKICHKSFNNEHKYQNHTCLHTDTKPFPCNLCTEIFSSKSALIQHSKTHNANKPYVCDICFKAFGDKNILRMHYNTHTGEKPFACTICDKVFSNTVSLKNHYEMHIGEKPYVCDVCLSSFDHKSSLCDHKLNEHNYLTLV